MVKKINRIIEKENKKKKSIIIDKTWQHPGHSREKLTIPFSGQTSEAIERSKAKRIRMLEEKNYMLINDESDINELWGDSAGMWMSRFYDESMVFMIWKYSQVLKKIDSEEERKVLLDALDEYQAQQIISCVIESKIHKQSLFVNDFGDEEISRSGQLVERDKKGEPNYDIKDGVVKGINRGNIGVHDLCLNTIKKAMEIQDIKINTKKKLTNPKK